MTNFTNEFVEKLNKTTEALNKISELQALGIDVAAVTSQLFDSLTLAQICVYSLGFGGKELTESQVQEFDDYLTILELIGIPVNSKVGDLSDAQKQAMEDGKDDLLVLNKLKAIWKKANND